MDFITIDTIKFDQEKSLEQDIINFPMDPIINSYFNKHTMY